jgi:hypothetical protein
MTVTYVWYLGSDELTNNLNENVKTSEIVIAVTINIRKKGFRISFLKLLLTLIT